MHHAELNSAYNLGLNNGSHKQLKLNPMNPHLAFANYLLAQRIEIDKQLLELNLVVENNELLVSSSDGPNLITEVDLVNNMLRKQRITTI